MKFLWDVLNIIGTIAFAVSGAIVALEEEYDLFGVFILGGVTAFGGGTIRNILIGVPVVEIWQQGTLFLVAVISVTVVLLIPRLWLRYLFAWMLFDAVGLAAFALQGAMYAESLELPFVAVIAAAVLTGSGGGMVRDILAGRKPLVFRQEIYAAWAALGGLIVYIIGAEQHPIIMLSILVFLCMMRVLSVRKKWRLPRRKLSTEGS